MKYVVEDSSFFISLLDPTDTLHSEAIDAFRIIIRHSVDTRVVVPTFAFHETLFTLVKNGVPIGSIKPKLIRFLMIDEIICHSLNEITILKLINKFKYIIDNASGAGIVKTYDASIVTVATEFENSCLITSDRGMKTRHLAACPNIFLFNDPTDMTNLEGFLATP